MRKGLTLAVIVAVLFGWFGVAVSAQAVVGTSVSFDTLQAGLPTTLKVTNTNTAGTRYKQAYGTTRNNVAKTCPPSGSYKLRYRISTGYKFASPGKCKTWLTSGVKPLGLFRADYTPPIDPPPPVGEWPDATTTGFQGDVAALPVRSGWRVTTPGAVIENVRIVDGLVIDAPNVTVRDVVIDAGYWGIDALNTSDGLVVEDTTINGGAQAGIGIDHSDGWLVQRVNLSGGNDGIKPGGSGTVRDTYIHDLGSFGSDPHNDAMQFGDAWGINVLHNRMECKDTSCLAMFGGQAQFDDVTIEGNWMGGAGYLIYAGGYTSSNIVIRNNTMGSYGYQHPVTDWVNRPGNVFENNTYTSGAPVPVP